MKKCLLLLLFVSNQAIAQWVLPTWVADYTHTQMHSVYDAVLPAPVVAIHPPSNYIGVSLVFLKNTLDQCNTLSNPYALAACPIQTLHNQCNNYIMPNGYAGVTTMNTYYWSCINGSWYQDFY